MRPILVSGAQGFVGRAFVVAALGTGERIVGIGRSERDDARWVPEMRAPLQSPAYAYRVADVLDPQALAAVIADTNPRAIVHLAAALRDDPFETLIRTNVTGTMKLFDAIDRAGVSPECIVLASSGAVYGKPATLPIAEGSPCEPIDLYGTSKLAAERIAAIRCATLPSRLAVARIFNVVGAGQDERHVCGRFAEQAVTALAEDRNVLHVGDLRPTRDFLDVRDAATALMTLLRSGSGTYNVCSGVETQIEAILQITLAQVGLSGKVRLERTYRRDADVSRHVGSSEKLRALGWAPRYTIDESIGDLVTYYRSPATNRV